jgi:hypothetical protein
MANRRNLRARALTAGASVLLVATAMTTPPPVATAAGSTFGYKHVGFDPDDRPIDPTSCCQQDPDIRSTMRRVWEDAGGRRWLTIKFRAYEWLIGYWSVTARLDSRGGRSYDYRLTLWDDGLGQAGCYLRPGHRIGQYHPSEQRDRVRCRVPLRWVEPTKQIRWRLFSPKGLEGTGVRIYEHAPDHGWYPRR